MHELLIQHIATCRRNHEIANEDAWKKMSDLDNVLPGFLLNVQTGFITATIFYHSIFIKLGGWIVNDLEK